MKVNLVTEKSDVVKKFEEIEWPIVDKEHYGTADVDFTIHPFFLAAEDNDEVVGIIQGKIQGGVCTINDLIVAHNKRGQGVGTELMAEIERYAANSGAHKIRLVTGDGWPAIKFYEKLSYKETARRPNDMLHINFIEYTKFINQPS